MRRAGKRIQPRLVWALSDLKWHDIDELIGLVRDTITPERASRYGLDKAPLEIRLSRGYRRAVVETLNAMRMAGLAEYTKDFDEASGKELIVKARLLPQAVQTLMNSKQSGGMLLSELRRLLESRKADITVTVYELSQPDLVSQNGSDKGE